LCFFFSPSIGDYIISKAWRLLLQAMLAPLRTRTQALPRWRQVEDPGESSLQQADHEKRSSKQDEVLSFGAGLFAGFVFSVMLV
jgi:hypothetical protein